MRCYVLYIGAWALMMVAGAQLTMDPFALQPLLSPSSSDHPGQPTGFVQEITSLENVDQNEDLTATESKYSSRLLDLFSFECIRAYFVVFPSFSEL